MTSASHIAIIAATRSRTTTTELSTTGVLILVALVFLMLTLIVCFEYRIRK